MHRSHLSLSLYGISVYLQQIYCNESQCYAHIIGPAFGRGSFDCFATIYIFLPLHVSKIAAARQLARAVVYEGYLHASVTLNRYNSSVR